MAAGLPVITTDRCVAGCELVENGKNGFIIPTENVEALQSAMLELISDPKRCYLMGIKSRERINKYTYENMASVITESLNELELYNE